MSLAFSVVISFGPDDSSQLLLRTLLASRDQKGAGERFAAHVSVWCTCGGDTANKLRQELSREENFLSGGGVTVVESSTPFLHDVSRSLALIEENIIAGSANNYVVLMRCGVLPRPRCLDFLADEIGLYERAAYTAFGFRLFPHEKLSSPLAELEKRVHYEFYPASRPSREVHVITPDFCCVGLSVLKSLTVQNDPVDFDVSTFPHIWWSFVVTCRLGLPIWQLKMTDFLDLSNISQPSSLFADSTVVDAASFYKFYHLAYDSDWPKGVSEVHYSQAKLDVALQSSESPHEIWARGFAGVNMLADPASQFDFRAVASCGVRVVRVGAVGGAEDLMYLLDPSSSSEAQDEAHLLQALPRLRHSLVEIGRHGLKAIVTVVDMPGSLFFSLPKDKPVLFWEREDLRLRATKFWGIMAKSLVDLRHIIMGYDLINEPFTGEDREVSFDEPSPLAHMDTLNKFYRDTVDEIRLYDKETAIILNPLNFAMPPSMATLEPLTDPHIKYGIHCYHPYPLTLRRENGLAYPGPVPLYPQCKYSEKVLIDKVCLRKLFLDNVVSWQNKHGVPAHQILVAEFGICREVPGATEYLRDLIEIFSEFGWSWLLFSFRDEEWDALDYELGPLKSNMLHRSNCELFQSLAKHFR